MPLAQLETPIEIVNLSRSQKLDILIYERALLIRECRKTFYTFCRTLAPDFYRLDRPHLKMLCDRLQKLYQQKIFRIVRQTKDNMPMGLSVPYRKVKINMPPRFGKSRTLLLFCMWILGTNPTERVIYTSYNDKTASDFSRYVRDGIKETKNLPHQIVYSDIFPWTRLKEGDASFEKWALEGQFFSYIGAGIGGSITGKGGSVLIVDDPVKDSATAYNELALERIYKWYSGTFLSRRETDAFEIVNMTRWCSLDLCGRIEEDPEEKDLWYEIKLEASNLETGEMLCPTILDKKSYDDLKLRMDRLIFMANYHQQPIDEEGRLYKSLKTYDKLPDIEFDRIICYVDTADEGDDFHCAIAAVEVQGQAYILDVLYTKEGMEVTEPQTVDLLLANNVNFCKVESNSGGRGFARSLRRIMQDRYDKETEEIDRKVRRTNILNYTNIKRKLNTVLTRERYEEARKAKLVPISWFHQSENKRARILSNASFVETNIFFPKDWDRRWPLFHKSMTTYQREQKNKYDDAEDAITGIAEMVIKSRPRIRLV